MNRYLNLSEVLKFGKIQNEPKTRRNEVMQPTTSKNDSRPVFPYYVHNQADLDNPFINERGFIYFGISKLNLTF